MPQYRSDENEYMTAITKMLHLEEAAQSNDLLQFNAKNLKLAPTNKNPREFQIKIDVKLT